MPPYGESCGTGSIGNYSGRLSHAARSGPIVRCRPRRYDSQGCPACRPPRGAADEIPDGGQAKDRQGTRHLGAALDFAAGDGCDRVTLHCATSCKSWCCQRAADVSFWLGTDSNGSEIDVRCSPNFGHSEFNVRFAPSNGHQRQPSECRLLTHSGHSASMDLHYANA